MLGVPIEYFGLIFLTTVIGYVAGSAISARLSLRRSPRDVLLGGGLLAVGACAAMLLMHIAMPSSVAALVVPMTFFAAAMGLVFPHAMAMAMEHFPAIAATNSALFGFLQMGLAALTTAGVGLALGTTPLPMIIIMLLLVVIAQGLFAIGWKRHSAMAPVTIQHRKRERTT
jgi:DHA1 family bicyclomycin/chloramphenicol resistance-like MFS transporter